ncbi:MAG: hypothetical protein MUC92_04820 [Fimbriimonadaceae bacterium]|jgi:hypothetical protein|nr:hypothetical protein [Fimbriimonadaceae bacterium]
MSGYLVETKSSDGDVVMWQTPNRQRLWGLAGMAVGAGILIYEFIDLRRVDWSWSWIGWVILGGSYLAASWTIRFALNYREQGYRFVRGFLPFLFGEKGESSAFQCVSIRREMMLDATKHEGETDSFDQFRVFIVWKDPKREAMLLDTFPADYKESLTKRDFYADALARAKEFAKGMNVELLDQVRGMAVVVEDDKASSPVSSSS